MEDKLEEALTKVALNEKKIELTVHTVLSTLNLLQEVYLWLDKDARYSRANSKCVQLQDKLLVVRSLLRKDFDEGFIKEKV